MRDGDAAGWSAVGWGTVGTTVLLAVRGATGQGGFGYCWWGAVGGHCGVQVLWVGYSGVEGWGAVGGNIVGRWGWGC